MHSFKNFSPRVARRNYFIFFPAALRAVQHDLHTSNLPPTPMMCSGLTTFEMPAPPLIHLSVWTYSHYLTLPYSTITGASSYFMLKSHQRTESLRRYSKSTSLDFSNRKYSPAHTGRVWKPHHPVWEPNYTHHPVRTRGVARESQEIDQFISTCMGTCISLTAKTKVTNYRVAQ